MFADRRQASSQGESCRPAGTTTPHASEPQPQRCPPIAVQQTVIALHGIELSALNYCDPRAKHYR